MISGLQILLWQKWPRIEENKESSHSQYELVSLVAVAHLYFESTKRHYK